MSLAAENLNTAFLQHFLPETLYVVPEEKLMPMPPENPAVATIQPVALAAPHQGQLPATGQPAPVAPAEAASPAPKNFDIIGENAKGVVVLVTLPDAAFQTLPRLEFLNKILAAIGLQAGDVAFVNNVSGANAVFEEVTQQMEVNNIISFASRIDTQLPHDKFTLYRPVVVDQVPIIFSQSLAVLDKDPEQKKLLWNALRQVFL